MTKEEIIEKLRTVLADEFEVDIDIIQPEAPLMQTLDLDSLDMVDIVVLINQHFGITVKGADFTGITTFQDFYDFLTDRLAAKE